MAVIPRAISTNKLATSKFYPNILAEYNRQIQLEGRVNAKQFHASVIAPLIPEYKLASWYAFLKKFKLMANNALSMAPAAAAMVTGTASEEEGDLQKTIMTNAEATNKGINAALNIGATRLQEILANPNLLSAKEAAELLIKAMKAQDSRIAAHGRIREDGREQAKFDRTFGDAAYS